MQQPVQYTVWNRGRLIGRTDLGFRRCMAGIRCGWFHPTPEAGRVLGVVSAVSPALRAVVRREVNGDVDDSHGRSAARCSAEYADLAEALQHLDGLELELRRDDGSVVPAVDIGIQDMLQLGEALPEDRLAELEDVDWDVDDGMFSTIELDDLLDPDPEGDDDAFDELGDGFLADWVPDRARGHADAIEAPIERYQLLVTLADDDAIP